MNRWAMFAKWCGLLMLTVAGAVHAAPPTKAPARLPGTLTITAYDTGSSGFNQAVAVGNMLKKRFGTDLEVLPAGTDLARLAPLKDGRAQASAMGIGTWYAQEGVLEFAVREWGPQPLQLLLSSSSCGGQSLGAAGDAGVKSAADLRGKRAGIVVGSPAVNQSTLALLAFGGWTSQDVRLVEFASYGAMMKGVVDNRIDLFFASTIAGFAKEVASSPRGIVWVPMPAADQAGWARLQKLAPYFYPHAASCGAGFAAGQRIETSVYPYPIFMTYGLQDAALVYALTRAMLDGYDDFKDAAPGADGLEGRRQNLAWTMPYHPGAVRALTEAGLWTRAAQRHNAALLQRQAVLAAAWKSFVATRPPQDKEQFRGAWMKARATALRKAGLAVLFE